MVPREREQWVTRIGNDYLAFKAVELQRVVQISTANGDANSNNYIYLILDGEPTAFCIASGKSNPIWDTFFAGNKGVFKQNGKFKLTCIRQKQNILADGDDKELKPDIGLELESLTLDAEAIFELRYEYALNLLHKFGFSQTRVGLGFTDSKGFMQ